MKDRGRFGRLSLRAAKAAATTTDSPPARAASVRGGIRVLRWVARGSLARQAMRALRTSRARRLKPLQQLQEARCAGWFGARWDSRAPTRIVRPDTRHPALLNNRGSAKLPRSSPLPLQVKPRAVCEAFCSCCCGFSRRLRSLRSETIPASQHPEAGPAPRDDPASETNHLDPRPRLRRASWAWRWRSARSRTSSFLRAPPSSFCDRYSARPCTVG
jgi:hypothetical protein